MRARRLEVLDEYVEEDEAVVFVGGRVVALSALATMALFSVGAEWTEAAVVEVALVGKFQEPPPGTDPAAVTHNTLLSLAQLGLLELEKPPSDTLHARTQRAAFGFGSKRR